jgi:LmbE family N-acetylglucosaminyl deacetylase
MATEPVPSLLAVGAHVGDVEVTMGAIIAAHTALGASATICHLTLGEGGHGSKSPAEYAPQRRREAEASARILGAELVTFPFADLGFAGGPEVVEKLAGLIRECRPDVVLCHWPGSFHSGHSHAANCAMQAVSHAASGPSAHRVGSIYCPENWEDPFHFVPELYVDVSDVIGVWEKSCLEHELFRGGASPFRYLDYYRGAFAAHGAVAGCAFAVAVAVPPSFSPRRVTHLPDRRFQNPENA